MLTLFVTSATIRGSTSTAIIFLPRSSRAAVRLPVPGPISKMMSVALMPDFSTIYWTTSGFLRIC